MSPDRMRVLRGRAEAFLRSPLREAAATSVEDTRTLIQDLQLYQIELEMQNEELRAAQLALAEARDRYHALYDFAPVGYLTLDDAGTIEEANLTAASLLGIDRARLAGRALATFIAPAGQSAYTACWEAARKGRSRPNDVVEFQLDDRRHRQMRLELRRVPPGESPTVWRLILTDVTVQHQLDADRARLDAHMQQTQKLQSLQVLAGGVAHDFKNLLTIIAGSTALGLDRLSPGAPMRDYLEEIEQAAARAITLTDQMLAYAGRTTIVVGPINLSATIGEMAPLLQAVVITGTTIELTLAPDLPSVIANRTEIQQVVMNVVLNASESLDRGGAVCVRTRDVRLTARDLEAMTHAEEAVEGRFVRLDVADKGIGMSDDTRDRMFEPFFTTKVAGRGLGLAAVLGIVNRHGGAIDVKSQPARGTRVSIFVPVATDEPADVSSTLALVPGAGLRLRGTALVVDDEPGARWLALRILNRAGMRVLEASDGRQAIETCKAYGSAIDVILLDLHMPGPPAAEVLRSVLRVAPNARIILTSADPPASDTVHAGATALLQKPYTAGSLMETVRLSL